jgi:hypothetical protein
MLDGRRYRGARLQLYFRARRPGAEFSTFYFLNEISIRYLLFFPKEINF